MQTGHVLYIEGRASSLNEVKVVLEDLNCTIHVAERLDEAESLMTQKQIELVILNIEENDKVATINFAINQNNKDIPFIFLAYDNNRFIYEAAKQSNCIAYLVSPIDMLTLRSIVEYNLKRVPQRPKYKKWIENKQMEDTLFIKVNQLLQKVNISDITHVQSEGNYCLIYTLEKKYAIKLSMVRLSQHLAGKGFFQVHKSYLAQLNKIDNIDISSNGVIIGHLRIPLGRKYKQELLAHLNLL